MEDYDLIIKNDEGVPFETEWNIINTFLKHSRKIKSYLTRRQHKFLCLERATIAEWQGASEDQKFVAKPTQSNITLFFANTIWE